MFPLLLLLAGATALPGHGTSHGLHYSYPSKSTAISPSPSATTTTIKKKMIVEWLGPDTVVIDGREFVAAGGAVLTNNQRRGGATPSPPSPDCPGEEALTPASGAEFWM